MDPDESLLDQVFCLSLVLGHAQQIVVDGTLVFMKDVGKLQRMGFLSPFFS